MAFQLAGKLHRTLWQESHVALSAAEGPELHRAQNVSGTLQRLVGQDFRLFGKLRVTLTLGVGGLFSQGNGVSTCWQITQDALAQSHVALSAAEGSELHRAQNVSGTVPRLVGQAFGLFG